MTRTETALASLAFATASLLAGSGTAGAQDPAVVNAKTVTVRLDNERVRVLEAVLEPGDKEQLHSHPAYVTYAVAGGKMRLHNADGSTRDADVPTGAVVFTDPLTHWAENIGDTTVRFILVELKPRG